jgi:hypothetical protein
MTLEQIEQALLSLKGYFGVVGCFGGNPAMRKDFAEVCALWRKHVPFNQSGIWSNNPITLENAVEMRQTFDPAISNLNAHLDKRAAALFKQGWPESYVFGINDDSRHSPVFGSMIDLGVSESERWKRISRCPINQHWSAGIGAFRGELRAYFCEIAMAQALLHQNDPDYPDTGVDFLVSDGRVCSIPQFYGKYGDQSQGSGSIAIEGPWWRLLMQSFRTQVRQHCHNCLVPMQGIGQLACDQTPGTLEITTKSSVGVVRPKNSQRGVIVANDPLELGTDRLRGPSTRYLQNA